MTTKIDKPNASNESENWQKPMICLKCGRPIVPTTSPYLYYCVYCEENHYGKGWTK